MTTTGWILVILGIIVLAAILWMYFEKKKTRRLRGKFGPEYERAIRTEGGARRAEAVLESREKRVTKYQIRTLTPEECEMYSAQWRRVQEHFVDDPRAAVAEADTLVNKALRDCGYPMAGFEQQAEDLSVDHPRVMENYRLAHEIALRDGRGAASTEDLRRAMQHYRSLFEDVLGRHVTAREEVHR